MSELPADWEQQLRKLYPKRDGSQNWGAVRRLVPKAIANGADWAEIMKGVRHYAIFCGRKGQTGSEYVLQAATFMGRDMHWAEWAEYDTRSPQVKAEDAQWEKLEARARALGFKEVSREKGLAVAEFAIQQAEKARVPLRVVS